MISRHFFICGAILATLFTCTSCRQPTVYDFSNAPYQFDTPDAIIDLPGELREISGISSIDDRHIAAIQDEKGLVYRIDLADGNIVERTKFGIDADYEDLEVVDSTIFVLSSDGRILRIEGWPGGSLNSTTVYSGFPPGFNIEGIAYDSLTKNLLLACKDIPGSSSRYLRVIYAFDPDQRIVSRYPFLTIPITSIARYVRRDKTISGRLISLLSGNQFEHGFKPSAIAEHPLTGELYVVSAETKLIAIFSRDRQIQSAYVLPDDVFPQPEGIEFLRDGDLLISNEARGRSANITRFKYRVASSFK